MRTLQNFIGGEYRDAADGRTVALVDPTSGQAFAESPVSGEADVDAACKAAARGFETWRDATPSERSRALLRIADAMEERAEELVRLECQNTGKPFQLTMDEEVPPALDQIRFFAGAARLLSGLSTGEYMAGHTSMIRREPIGVCAQVTPWNYPFMMAVWKWAPAIAAGNAVVLKPSDTTPVTTVWMAELMSEFLPPGVINVICGDRGTGAALVRHRVPAMASVTGSVRAGTEVARAAADDLKRVHLELGGKAPVIVFDDADAEAAATRSRRGAGTSTSPPWWPASSSPTRWSSRRSSGRSSPCSASTTRRRRWPGPTTSSTGSPRAYGPVTTAAPCGWRGGSTSAASGSTPTSRWSPRCPTAASSTPATARTCPCTGSRTTPASST